MKKPWESLETYHKRKIADALDYLYPDSDSKEELSRIVNMEQEVGSYISACSGILLTEITPLTEYDITSVLIALKGNLNFIDEGQVNTKPCYYKDSKTLNVYKLDWKPFW